MSKVILVVLLLSLPSFGYAEPFYFNGTDEGGIGIAEMDISTSGNILTVTVDNLSPTLLDSSPAIVGFGFDINDPEPGLLSWELTGYEADGSLVRLDSDYWDLDQGTKVNGTTLDFQPNIQDVKGGLYNPDATSGFAADPNYFTEATLTLTFDNDPIFDPNSVYIRMKNVGDGGSLKLYRVPEPSTIALLLIGLAGAVCTRRRKMGFTR